MQVNIHHRWIQWHLFFRFSTGGPSLLSKPFAGEKKKTDPRKPTETAAAIQAGFFDDGGQLTPTEDHSIPETNIYTLLGTNISPENCILKMIFLFLQVGYVNFLEGSNGST